MGRKETHTRSVAYSKVLGALVQKFGGGPLN